MVDNVKQYKKPEKGVRLRSKFYGKRDNQVVLSITFYFKLVYLVIRYKTALELLA